MPSAPKSRRDERRAAFRTLLAPLTREERRVLRRFMEQPNDKAIAQALGKQTQTIRNQIASVLHKLGVTSREELIALVLHTRYRGHPPRAEEPRPTSRYPLYNVTYAVDSFIPSQ